MNMNKTTRSSCPECCQSVGHKPDCVAGKKPDLVLPAPDGRDELRALAEVATPGPWYRGSYGGIYTSLGGWAVGSASLNATWCRNYALDEPYIAAANPQAILALLDELNDVWRLLRMARKDIGLQALVIQSKNTQIAQVEAVLAQALATPASPASAPEASERAKFEAWARPDAAQNRRDDSGAYTEPGMSAAWAAWQARASLAPLPPGVARKELTDEQIAQIIDAAQVKCVHPGADTTKDIARAIERHLAGKPDDKGGDTNG